MLLRGDGSPAFHAQDAAPHARHLLGFPGAVRFGIVEAGGYDDGLGTDDANLLRGTHVRDLLSSY
jgi:hypothetical protein